MTEKLKLEIKHVEEEENSDGIAVYKMTLQTQKGSYERGIMVSHWDNERDRRSIKKKWIKDIGRIEAEQAIKESKTKEERKAETKAKIKSIEGTAIEDE